MYTVESINFQGIDERSSLFVYEQIYRILMNKIMTGEFKANQKFPSECELSRFFRVNRHTIRKAIEKIRNEGYVYTIKGRGTFVSSKKIPYKVSAKTRFTESILNLGHEPDAELIDSYEILAEREIREKLRLRRNTKVLVLEILRYVDKTPFCYSKSYLSFDRFSKIRNFIKGTFSLYKILREVYHIEPFRASSIFEVELPGSYELRLLGISNKTPLLTVKSLAVDRDGTPVEYCMTKFRGDLCSVYLNFDLVGR